MASEAECRRPAMSRCASVAVAGFTLAACNSPSQVSDSGYGAYEVSLATWQGSAIAIVWYDTRDGNAELYLRFIERAGRPLGEDRRLTRTPDESFEPSVSALADGFAVAWYEQAASGTQHAQLAVWSLDLEQRWSRPLGNAAHPTRNPVVRATTDGLFAAWIEQNAPGEAVVRAAWFGLDGTPRSHPAVLGRAGPTTWNVDAAVDSHGHAFVAYDSSADTRADELFLAEISGEAVSLTRLTRDDGRDSKYPDVAFGSDGRLALTWFDTRDGNAEVYLFAGTLDELRAGGIARARRVTDTPGESIGAYVAWNGDRIGLAWSDDSAGAHDIYYEAFAPDGAPLDATQRLTATATSSLIPAIEPWRDGFALAWNELALGSGDPHDPSAQSEVMLSLVH
jgi:hypothetical protein